MPLYMSHHSHPQVYEQKITAAAEVSIVISYLIPAKVHSCFMIDQHLDYAVMTLCCGPEDGCLTTLYYHHM